MIKLCLMKYLYVIAIIFISIPVFGQIDSFNSDLKRNISFMNSLKGVERKNKISFYLEDDWNGGVIFANDSSVINGCTFKYNIYADQMEMRTLVNPSNVTYLSIGTKKFIYTDYLIEDSILFDGYFELILNGECKLLLRREVKAIRGEEDVKIYGSSGSTRISEIFYMKKGNEPAIKIEKTEKFFKERLSDKDEMKDYFNNHFLLFLSEKKIRDIIMFYNKI